METRPPCWDPGRGRAHGTADSSSCGGCVMGSQTGILCLLPLLFTLGTGLKEGRVARGDSRKVVEPEYINCEKEEGSTGRRNVQGETLPSLGHLGHSFFTCPVHLVLGAQISKHYLAGSSQAVKIPLGISQHLVHFLSQQMCILLF